MSFGWNYSAVPQHIENRIILLVSYPSCLFPEVFFFSLSFSFYIKNLVLCINKERRKGGLPSNCWMIKIKPQKCRFWPGSNEETPKVKQPDVFYTLHKNISKCYIYVFNNKSYCNTHPKITFFFFYRREIAQKNRLPLFSLLNYHNPFFYLF